MEVPHLGDDEDLPSSLINNKLKKRSRSEQAKLLEWAGIPDGGIKFLD